MQLDELCEAPHMGKSFCQMFMASKYCPRMGKSCEKIQSFLLFIRYNQNFRGVYCICHRPYPDPEDPVPDEMIQGCQFFSQQSICFLYFIT